MFCSNCKKNAKKGIKRSLGTTIVYVIFIGFLVILVCSIIPVLTHQINDFVATMPSIFDSMKTWVNKLFDNLNNIEGLDAMSFKNKLFEKLRFMVLL